MNHFFSTKRSLPILMILFSMISGCVATSGNFVKQWPDGLVTRTFENFTVIPGYNYYYYGPISFPRSFVGISKDFTMDSSLWKPIDLTSKTLRDWIWVRADRSPGDSKRYGARIIGPNGEKIGVWYSLEDWEQWASIKLTDKKIIKIGMPIDKKTNRIRFGKPDN